MLTASEVLRYLQRQARRDDSMLMPGGLVDLSVFFGQCADALERENADFEAPMREPPDYEGMRALLRAAHRQPIPSELVARRMDAVERSLVRHPPE